MKLVNIRLTFLIIKIVTLMEVTILTNSTLISKTKIHLSSVGRKAWHIRHVTNMNIPPKYKQVTSTVTTKHDYEMDSEILYFWYSQILNKPNQNLQIPRGSLKLISTFLCTAILDYFSHCRAAFSFKNLKVFLISLVCGHKNHQRTLKYIYNLSAVINLAFN